MVRGGHVDATVLGALQVSLRGDLANWMVPGKMVKGMGGAGDMVAGAKRVIIMMDHVTKEGHPKILNECTLPLTGRRCVDLLVTDLAVIEIRQAGMILLEAAPGLSAKDVQDVTEPELLVAPEFKPIEV
jgi:3-oxoacid CoA-transferase subunit B